MQLNHESLLLRQYSDDSEFDKSKLNYTLEIAKILFKMRSR